MNDAAQRVPRRRASRLEHSRAGRRAAPLLLALRPRQWSKNLLVFAGLVFAGKLADGHRWAEATGIFVAYCLASGAAYLLNDLLDLEHDRLHPVKRRRPIAAGLVLRRTVLTTTALTTGLALALAAALGALSLFYLAGFIALQVAYSLGLKHVAIADVLAVSAGFVIRAAAGAQAVHVAISPWLLACTALLSLFLALAKRRGELVLVGVGRTPGRPVLETYSLEMLETLLAITAAATVATYSAYTVLVHSAAMTATIPYVVVGIARYLYLVHRRDLGEEPENVLLKDRIILTCVAGWAATAAAILALT